MSSPSLPPIRILLLNNDAIARAGVKMLLESRPGFLVNAQEGDKKAPLKLAEQEQPDVVLLHESAEDSLGLDFISHLVGLTKKPRIILITARCNPGYHLEAVQKGAMGIVVAQNHPEILFKAIEKVHAGEVWLDRALIANFVVTKTHREPPAWVNPQAARIAQLSKREKEIIALVGEGFKNQQIADTLFLSEVTVRHHLTSIFKKLGVCDRLELVIYAYQNSLAQLPE
jgi:DNA-binding NarL/FixJ family response regulator